MSDPATSGEIQPTDETAVMHRGKVCDEAVVNRRDVRAGDFLHIAADHWASIQQDVHTTNHSYVWLHGFYYPLVLDGSSLATVRRPRVATSGRTKTSTEGESGNG